MQVLLHVAMLLIHVHSLQNQAMVLWLFQGRAALPMFALYGPNNRSIANQGGTDLLNPFTQKKWVRVALGLILVD